MPSLSEVALLVDRALDDARRAVVALSLVEESAGQAVGLLVAAGAGAEALEADFAEVAGLWRSVVSGAVRLRELLAVGIEHGERVLVALTGVPAASVPVETEWERRELPAYVTSGYARYRSGGGTELVQSGREPDGEHERIAEHLIAAGVVRRGVPTVAMHVEIKVAWRLRERGGERAEVVINNLVCDGPLSCRRLAAVILKAGQELVVHDPEGRHVFRGRSSR
ncbi:MULTISPECIES: DddA-like double-stranded DNA deaminase toxin [Actinosynnema]|uniref:DddA-like double-stranded DNA deaminase toxin n=1 Tax=Actinosynnema TaxID=40566 RepID=UPI0020A2A9B6|nr:DddA-like double-stranded DNA deaminase toxin [Actinosynnema pretiosum]MCP2095138.1 SCP1.201-like deaminase [Actinosynnema pretiosum]